jgi:hypothetical protein
MAPNSNIWTNPSEKISPGTIATKKVPLKNTLITKVTPGAYHLAGNPGLRGSPISLRRRSHLPVTTSSLPISNMNLSFRNYRDSVLSIRDDIKIDPPAPAPASMIDLKAVEDLWSIGEQTIRERKDSDQPMINVQTPMGRQEQPTPRTREQQTPRNRKQSDLTPTQIEPVIQRLFTGKSPNRLAIPGEVGMPTRIRSRANSDFLTIESLP